MTTELNLQDIYNNALEVAITQCQATEIYNSDLYQNNLKTIKYLIDKGANPFALTTSASDNVSIMLRAIKCRSTVQKNVTK